MQHIFTENTLPKVVGIVCVNHKGVRYHPLPILEEKPNNIESLFNDQRFIVYNKADAVITLFFYDDNDERQFITLDISNACESNAYTKLFLIRKNDSLSLFATTNNITKEFLLC